MVWLDALLTQLLSKGHRIVVFSQFTRILDIICDYLNLKSIRHCRLDGQTNPVLRQVIIDQFNRLGSRENVFVASTRAGGEGINLQSADTVILYDSDWYMTSKIFHHISIRQTRNSNIFQESSKRHSSNRPCTSHWPTKHRPHLQTRDCWISWRTHPSATAAEIVFGLLCDKGKHSSRTGDWRRTAHRQLQSRMRTRDARASYESFCRDGGIYLDSRLVNIIWLFAT